MDRSYKYLIFSVKALKKNLRSFFLGDIWRGSIVLTKTEEGKPAPLELERLFDILMR